MKLDRYDYALLELVQKDCQTPLRKLAEAVHLSTASVQRRIHKLRGNGYIVSNVAILDPDKLNQVITILVEVEVNRTHISELEVLKQRFSGPEVQQCYYVTGAADFVLILVVPNMQRFQEICDKFFHENDNIKSFRTTVVLERVKSSLNVL
ncbi:Lrp/AsnC family transcriptional regulator [Pseudoalteromonas rhizosphaerae]|uniref:Lrp/AsnC family transcriptional regulator n=1 Tax=Pseudoalteromonas rhizosphaerae TaxID=2518973 RepID=UPI00384DE88E